MKPIAASIRSGLGAKNDELKAALINKLAELETSVARASELARAAQAYGEYLENISELLWLSRRLQRVVNDNKDDLEQAGTERYAVNWKLVDTVLEMIDARSEVPRKGWMGLDAWYYKDDEKPMHGLLHGFSTAYNKATGTAKYRKPHDLEYHVAAMVSSLQEAETLIRTTVYDRILGTLQQLNNG